MVVVLVVGTQAFHRHLRKWRGGGDREEFEEVTDRFVGNVGSVL